MSVALASHRMRDKGLLEAVAIAHPVIVVIHLLTWWLSEDTSLSPEILAELIERLAFRPLETGGKI